MKLASHELGADADFIDSSSFRLNVVPHWLSGEGVPTGLYELPRRTGEAHLFRVNHPLGQAIVARAQSRDLSVAEIVFDYLGREGRISQIELLKGRSGWLAASMLSVEALGQSEDHLLLAGTSDDGTTLSAEAASRMMTIAGGVAQSAMLPDTDAATLSQLLTEQQAFIRGDISQRNARFFEIEANKLDGWADDLKVGLERDLKELDRQIKEARRAATLA
jgi:hypothetical protein